MVNRMEDGDDHGTEPVAAVPVGHQQAQLVVPRILSLAEACTYHDVEYVKSLFTPPVDPATIRKKRRKTLRTTATQPAPAPTPFPMESIRPTPLTQPMGPHALAVAGASVTAAECLVDDQADVAIAFDGGRHHAHKASAEGFCYINDIVLAIQTLRRPRKRADGVERWDKVVYLDLDLHWGDGVVR